MSDLIKREDAIKAIEELPNAYNGWSDTYDKAYNIGTLEEVPSADRPQEEWEIVALGWHTIRRCSNCKWTQTYSDPKYMGYRYNFCPNCGADMRGADDE